MTLAVNLADQQRKLANVVHSQLATQQHRLPVLMRLRDGGHAEQMMPVILEDERRDTSRRRQFGQPAQAIGLAVNPARIAEPIDLRRAASPAPA